MEKVLQKLFFILCLVLSCYMAYLQLKDYMKNEDSASISYQVFNNQEKDEYPTFTICFSGYGGENFENDFNATGLKYATMQNIQRPMTLMQGEIPLVAKLSLPGKTCLTKTIPYQKDLKQLFDNLGITISWLNIWDMEVELYIHERDKLLRSFGKPPPAAIFSPNDYSDGICKNYEINDVEVLRKRENSKVPCNKSLSDEDGYIMTRVMQKAECIPDFWEQFADQKGLANILPKCTSDEDDGKIMESFGHFMAGIIGMKVDYVETCTQMTMSIATTSMDCQCRLTYDDDTMQGFYNDTCLEINVSYKEDEYKEIQNSRAFTVETLWGSIAGYVGRKIFIPKGRNRKPPFL